MQSISCQATDKGYDSFASHRAILDFWARPVIPPRTGAAFTPPPKDKGAPKTRGEAVRRIAAIGTKAWKIETGHHRRSLAETAIAASCINTVTALGNTITVEIK